MIPQSFIQDLLARVDIVEVIERYLPLKKGGANYFACCPFHGEKSASFSVSPTKPFYHCFGCGVHGSAISFLMEYNGLGFIDAVKELASTVGMEVPEDDFTPNRDRAREQSLTEIMAQAARFYKEQLKRSPVAIDYLKGRGLTGEVAARYATCSGIEARWAICRGTSGPARAAGPSEWLQDAWRSRSCT